MTEWADVQRVEERQGNGIRTERTQSESGSISKPRREAEPLRTLGDAERTLVERAGAGVS